MPLVDSSPARYGRFLIFIAGLGGLLYGIDVGIIAAALLYLGKTVNLSVAQTSVIVAAVLGGSMGSSLVAGVLADWFGRKKMMIVSALLFIASVGLIVISQGFVPLLLGRLLQGVSGGVIAVVVPLYLAECLSAGNRGKGTAFFQFMLTFGIVIAALAGWFYTHQAEAAIQAASGNPALIRAAQDHAWRSMFLSVIYPGLLFFSGAFFLSESPRWLYRRGRIDEAHNVLRRSLSNTEAQVEMQEMQDAASNKQAAVASGTSGSLLQRKYVVPFLLACIILACNQTTGINSILGFLVLILRQAGMSANHATGADVAVKLLNCAMTVVAVALVDRKGRKFLLKLGTGGIVIALTLAASLFLSIEHQRVDQRQSVQAAIQNNALHLLVNAETFGPNPQQPVPLQPNPQLPATTLTVLYSYGDGDKVASVVSTDPNPVLIVSPDATQNPTQNPTQTHPLLIKHAFYGPLPTETTGWLVAVCLGLFIASFSVGPGVVVWLALSELMPTRIRSTGMGIALLINQGMSTLIAAAFLPVAGNFGYSAMFLVWACCTVIYFLTAAFFLPETKGKTLEEIELYFTRTTKHSVGQTP